MRIGCLLTGILTLAPRLVILFFWLFTPRVSMIFEGILIPLLGFIFIPFATTAYILVWSPTDGVSGGGWLIVVGGLLFDVGTYIISGYLNRRYQPGNDKA